MCRFYFSISAIFKKEYVIMDSIEKAIQLMDKGQVDEALELLKQILPTASDDQKFMISDLYYEWGFFEESIDLLETLLSDYPEEGEIITKLAEMYIELEKDELAIDLLNQIDKHDAYYVNSLLQLADLYQAQGLFEVSEQKLLEAKQLVPDEKVIDFALGELLFSIGQYSRAIPFYERVEGEINDINGISLIERLAECHALIGHYEEALAYYEKSKSNEPDTLFKYGFTAFQQKRNDIAINVWKQLLEIDPHYHSVYPKLASAMKKEGQIKEAFAIVQEGLKYDEFNKELYYLAAQLSLSLNEQKEAITFLKEAILLDIDYREAILLLIQLYKDRNQHNDIIELITECKQAGANDPIYNWELARAYNEEELYEKALKSYAEANTYLSDDKEFMKEYGYFLTEEGLHKEAIEILEKYNQLEPFDEETTSFLERLKFSINE